MGLPTVPVDANVNANVQVFPVWFLVLIVLFCLICLCGCGFFLYRYFYGPNSNPLGKRSYPPQPYFGENEHDLPPTPRPGPYPSRPRASRQNEQNV
jgi:hypothetical protein